MLAAAASFIDNFRNSFHIFKTGSELFPGLFVIRRNNFFRRPAGEVAQAIFFCGYRRLLAPPVRLRRKKGAVA